MGLILQKINNFIYFKMINLVVKNFFEMEINEKL